MAGNFKYGSEIIVGRSISIETKGHVNGIITLFIWPASASMGITIHLHKPSEARALAKTLIEAADAVDTKPIQENDANG